MNDIASAMVSAAETGRLGLRAVVLFDWHDGPIEGIAEATEPRSFWLFNLVGDRADTNDLDDRIYLLARVPTSAMDPILAAVGPGDMKPLIWPFSDSPNQLEISEIVDSAVDSADDPSLLIRSRGLSDIDGIWRFTGRRFGSGRTTT